MKMNRHPEFNIEDYTKDNPELAKEIENEMKRMTNYEKIKNMTVDEMAEWFECNDLDIIELVCSDSESIKQWLQAESEG